MPLAKHVYLLCDSCPNQRETDRETFKYAMEDAEDSDWHVTSDGKVTCPDCRTPQIPEKEVRS